MQRFITDERNGITYELVGDYYVIAGDNEPQGKGYGVWGQRHCEFLRKQQPIVFCEMLSEGKLYDYLAEIDAQANDMFSRLVNQLAEKEGITEALKVTDQMEWVRRMNNIESRAREIVNEELIYA